MVGGTLLKERGWVQVVQQRCFLTSSEEGRVCIVGVFCYKQGEGRVCKVGVFCNRKSLKSRGVLLQVGKRQSLCFASSREKEEFVQQGCFVTSREKEEFIQQRNVFLQVGRRKILNSKRVICFKQGEGRVCIVTGCFVTKREKEEFVQ